MSSLKARLTDAEAMKIIDQVGDVFKSLPKLPEGIVEFFVKVAPYLALIGAVLSIVAGPLVGLLGSFASLITLNPLYFVMTLVSVVLMLAQAVLLFMAFKPLKDRELNGWVYLFWSEALGVVSGVLSIVNGSVSSLIFTLFWAAVWFYVLFQMRPFYKKA